jgi:hypothetical protein
VLVIEDSADLANYFASAQVPLDSELRGQTELAIHSATDLAGNADGGPAPGTRALGLFAGLAAITCFAPISIRHPNGFYALAIGETHQVTHRTIDRPKFPFRHGQPNRKTSLSKATTEILRQSRNLLVRFNPLPIKSVEELASTVRRLTGFFYKERKFLKVKP